MRIAIPALGSRGDVLPSVLLGDGLAKAGHHVRLATFGSFQPLVEAHGLEFQRLPGDPKEFFQSVRWDSLVISPWRPRHHTKTIHRGMRTLVDQVRPGELLREWRDVDAIIFSNTTTFGHQCAAELSVPSVMMTTLPAVSTARFAHPVVSPLVTLPAPGNYASWLIAERLQRQSFKEPLRPRSRRALGLRTLPLSPSPAGWPPFPVLHGYSATVLPRPDDWPEHVEVTGWLLPDPPRDPLPPEVRQFLDEGPAPVYVGLGSMPIRDPPAFAEMLVRVLAHAGGRAIVAGAGLRSSPTLKGVDFVLVADPPHAQLFEHVRAVVHHGGSGTVGAGLRAGRPTLVLPLMFDQFFWGRRVHSLGVGPRPIPFAQLSEQRLRDALTELQSDPIVVAAASLGERIRAEDPVGRTVRAVEQRIAAGIGAS